MDKMLGIYIHIPFCASRCSYCDFYSVSGRDNLMDKYLKALLRHIEESAMQMAPYYIDTVYFGGGTPSYFGAERICEVFNALKTHGKVLKSAEVTVELNPDSVTADGLKLMRDEGVNRLSIGLQSTNDDILRLIGRRHSFKQAESAIRLAQSEGFDNISLDLIYGLPTQTRSDWADTLSKTVALRPQHLSCYGLKIEEGTPICAYRGGDIPTDDDQADMYLYMAETLADYGYPQYEISNFSIPGFRSKHNLKYWDLDDYMGFGPGAHSSVGDIRYSYVRNIDAYISGVNGNDNIVDEYERVSRLDRASEYLMLGMRTMRGISQAEYTTIYRSDFSKIEYLLDEYEKKGWTERGKERWRFTSSGFLLSNILIGTLLEAQSQAKISANPWMAEAIGEEKPQPSAPSGGANLG